MSIPVIVNCDDNEPARYARTRILQRAGFVVHDAGTGERTLQIVRAVRPDLVLLDVNLPDMNGVEVCRLLKSQQNESGIFVLQISASATQASNATEALNAGADAYLIEPVDPEVLVATVRALLRLRQTERELAQSNVALREANNALRRSNEDLEHFAYVASHDLQEPLRTIRTHTQLLQRAMSGRMGPDEETFLNHVVDAALRMSVLIDDVLAYSRVTRSAPDFSAVPLSDPAMWARMNLMQHVDEVHAEIEMCPLPVIWGDPMQLTQVFQNLLGNALKYSTPGVQPKIRISAEQRLQDTWVISVSDNGIGIEPQYHERIFAAFKRLHGREIPGTGIGLAVCRRIIEAHGGQIWVDSEKERGSTFRFTLQTPQAAESEAASNAGE